MGWRDSNAIQTFGGRSQNVGMNHHARKEKSSVKYCEKYVHRQAEKHRNISEYVEIIRNAPSNLKHIANNIEKMPKGINCATILLFLSCVKPMALTRAPSRPGYGEYWSFDLRQNTPGFDRAAQQDRPKFSEFVNVSNAYAAGQTITKQFKKRILSTQVSAKTKTWLRKNMKVHRNDAPATESFVAAAGQATQVHGHLPGNSVASTFVRLRQSGDAEAVYALIDPITQLTGWRTFMQSSSGLFTPTPLSELQRIQTIRKVGLNGDPAVPSQTWAKESSGSVLAEPVTRSRAKPQAYANDVVKFFNEQKMNPTLTAPEFAATRGLYFKNWIYPDGKLKQRTQRLKDSMLPQTNSAQTAAISAKRKADFAEPSGNLKAAKMGNFESFDSINDKNIKPQSSARANDVVEFIKKKQSNAKLKIKESAADKDINFIPFGNWISLDGKLTPREKHLQESMRQVDSLQTFVSQWSKANFAGPSADFAYVAAIPPSKGATPKVIVESAKNPNYAPLSSHAVNHAIAFLNARKINAKLTVQDFMTAKGMSPAALVFWFDLHGTPTARGKNLEAIVAQANSSQTTVPQTRTADAAGPSKNAEPLRKAEDADISVFKVDKMIKKKSPVLFDFAKEKNIELQSLIALFKENAFNLLDAEGKRVISIAQMSVAQRKAYYAKNANSIYFDETDFRLSAYAEQMLQAYGGEERFMTSELFGKYRELKVDRSSVFLENDFMAANNIKCKSFYSFYNMRGKLTEKGKKLEESILSPTMEATPKDAAEFAKQAQLSPMRKPFSFATNENIAYPPSLELDNKARRMQKPGTSFAQIEPNQAKPQFNKVDLKNLPELVLKQDGDIVLKQEDGGWGGSDFKMNDNGFILRNPKDYSVPIFEKSEASIANAAITDFAELNPVIMAEASLRQHAEGIKEKILEDVRGWLRTEGNTVRGNQHPKQKTHEEKFDEMTWIGVPVDEKGDRGFSVFAQRDIEKYEVIGPYSGVFHADDESLRREISRVGSRPVKAYLWNAPGDIWISAFPSGNRMALINTGVSPGYKKLGTNNVAAMAVNNNMIFYVASEKIKKNDELLVNYGAGYNPIGDIKMEPLDDIQGAEHLISPTDNKPSRSNE